MQANQPQGGSAKASTPRYDTIVIRGATGKDVPREVDGGEVVSWARGHELAAGDALLEFVNYVADGDCGITPELSTKARKALDLMERRSRLGWEADEQPEDWPASVNRAAQTAREVFNGSHEDAIQAIEYMHALLLQAAPVVQGGDV
ncbi:hypothetical protein ACM79J_16315 [Pseudomonas aeruginosa]|jgi:hypothetical protein|uniref:hypothetical protein n=1 Tax=Pseudomonas aeruginosa group TaxID=136841 RepID=UPI00053E8D57|nr:hypothetical protein [Pseudomonas aeruginosa]AKO88403.1 hypothetical protein PA50071_21945 [Pseudomonas aeruginosa DSM 50071 = NBRC 12689]EKW9778575.1 hypothetical protein [Pseudomonas aeruginosa]ELQ2783801.1 hypothetical protein [Pseudomonas aeruginosa]ELQ4817934.1 hypothetical protein [Pseudomonas aeruginosa]KAA5558733.1 hypothetical protein F3G51_28040 [Pseudomonas aeruginosa]